MRRRLLLPVRRKLALAIVAWLAGIAAAQFVSLPIQIVIIFSALLLFLGVNRRRHRQSALLFVMGIMLLLGNAHAAHQLGWRDTPTDGKAELTGTVAAIEEGTRVYLTDVTVNGGAGPRRDVLVTLMLEENELREVFVGQRVGGTGRLFAQDEARNPGGTDRRITALCEGYELSGYVLPGWTAQGEAVFSVREAMRRARLELLGLAQTAFGEHAALFQGIMLGDKDGIDSQLVAAMRLTGTAHVLAVSGLHMSIVAAAVAGLLKRLRVRKLPAFIAQGVVLLLFTGITGAAPGTIRALVMAMLRQLAMLRRRRYEPLTALAIAAFVTTLICPAWLLNGSFQFSYYVVLGILLIEGRISSWMDRRLPFGVGRTIGVCVSAQIAAMPMTLMFYGYIPVFALPMNMLCSLIAPVLMLAGWGCAALAAVLPGAAQFAGSGAAWIANLFEAVSLHAAGVEGGIIRLPAPHPATLLLIAALLVLVSNRIVMKRPRYALAWLCALVIACSYLPRLDPAARYVQLDVGQGDGAVMRYGRHAVLMDVGPESSYDMVRYLRHEGLTVDAILLSHLDEDHAGALRSILNSEIGAGEIVMARGADADIESEAVMSGLNLAGELGVPVQQVEAGYAIDNGWMHIDVLAPDSSLAGSNERSMVLCAELAGAKILMTGDLPIECERGPYPDCDVLKVAHHGSKYATSDAFLAQTMPEIAIISVGAGNSYGHPTQRVLDSLDAVDAHVYRTDESGCVTLTIPAGRIETRTSL